MKNTFKRIAAIALAVLMCVSTIVVPTFAADQNACPGYGKTHTKFNCDYEQASVQEATCDNAGFETGRCKTCSTIFTVSQTEALGHDWDATVAAVCGEAATRTCKVCGEKETLGVAPDHLYTAYTVSGGVCAAGEEVSRTCVYCGEEDTDEVGPDGHYYSMVSYIAPADCVTPGVANLKCLVCGAAKTEAIQPELAIANHNWILWTEWEDEDKTATDPNYKAATCTAKGTYSVVCDDCGYIKVAVEDFADHKYNAQYKEALGPTCTTAGNIAYTQCTKCRQYFEVETTVEALEGRALPLENGKDDTVIPAIHNDFTKLIVIAEKAPNCVEAGSRTYSCTCSVEWNGTKYVNLDVENRFTVTVELPAFGGHTYYPDVTDEAKQLEILATLNTMTVEDYEDYLKENFTTVAAEWAKLFDLENETGKDSIYENFVAATCTENAKITWICMNKYIKATTVGVDDNGDGTYEDNVTSYALTDCCTITDPTKRLPTELKGEDFDAIGHDVEEIADGAYEPTCLDNGLKVFACQNDDCDYKYEEAVPALGHNFKVLTKKQILTGAYSATFEDGERVITEDDLATCITDGYTFEYCANECGADIKVTEAQADGETHQWAYESLIKPDGDPEYDDIDTVMANLPCGTSITVIRYCDAKLDGVNACEHYTKVKETVNGPEHEYVDVTDATVLKEIKDLENEGDTYKDKDGRVLVTYSKAGDCENGAKYTLHCLNCTTANVMTKTFEITEGYAKGHVKTYVGNSAVAAECGKNGHSNYWACSVEGCDYYWEDANKDKILQTSEIVNFDADYDGYDVTFADSHKIWNADKEKVEAVTYKLVPDANVSGAASLAKALEVEAPVVDGKVVRYVAIEGTSLVWVYKYTGETNHTELKTTTPGFYCVDCQNYTGTGAAAIVHGDADDHDFTTFVDVVENDCTTQGRTTYTCSDCFYSYQTAWTEAKGHDYLMIEDKRLGDTEKAWVDLSDAEKAGRNCVKATCTTAGYVIDKCVDCGDAEIVSIKATGHWVGAIGESEEITASCLNQATTRKCNICKVTINKAHNYNEAGVCQECGQTK